MDSRRRGFRSVPGKGHEYMTKSETADRRSLPLCPPLQTKVSRRITQRSLFKEKTFAKAIFFMQPVTLNRLYCPEDDSSYMEQIFKRVSILGEGSFGVVYKVKSFEDNHIYAIKQFKPNHNLMYAYAEVQNHEKIGYHKNCVQLVMAWEELKIIHIQMEYCSMSLAQYASGTRQILENQLWEIMYDMLQALDYLHSKNLIHLDVKPGNVLMSGGSYKLADFGLLVDLNKHDGRKISTISDGDAKYLACEVLDGIYTYSCDIFGLGISLLELATNIELPEFGHLWHQIRNNYLPGALYTNVSKSFSITIENMMCNIHCKRPKACILLRNANLRKVQKQDLKTPRNNYCNETLQPSFLQPNNVSLQNNIIVETPRRPIFEIRNGRSQDGQGLSDVNMNLDSLADSCQKLDDTSPCTRLGLIPMKLAF